jgi:predicted ATPase/class 3 adenylate cyclase
VVTRRGLQAGTVTFLFTDVEGSTRLLHELGAEAYGEALLEHRKVLRDAFAEHGGVEVDTQGDAFFVAFPTAPGAIAAAARGQEELATGPICVRMGLHTGTPHLTEEGYVGVDVHRAARIAAAGHGGQVLVSESTAALVHDEVELADLGEHRLKDLSAPERIYQLGEGKFPPLKTLYRTNLPVTVTAFVGREHEVAEVASILSGDSRLVTLTGPGGTGKTRLALQSAGALADAHPDGVWWVPLATLREPDLMLDTAAQAVGAKDDLAAHVGDQRMLVLLDNFEQLVEAAPRLPELLAACPNLRLLVTSRELLRVQGEVGYAVPPLADPEAVELFCARARIEPDKTVAELCRRLDNLPLAVELAAARTSVLTPAQIVERLGGRLDLLKGGRDADPRQQTLRATIEWSYDLLDDVERQLFARLAVFRRGCTLEAATAVADADIDVLQSLVDKSLVRHTGDRFWMLETIREYALELLTEDDLADRHADYYLALAEEAFAETIGPRPAEWLDRLEADHDNLRSALSRLEATGETQRALELAGALFGLWQVRGYFTEGARRLESALAADDSPTAARARALRGWVVLRSAGVPPTDACTRAEEALRIYESLGDDWGVAFAHWQLGGIATEERDWTRALDLFERARREFRVAGDVHHYLALTRGVAWVNEELGNIARYRELVEEYLAGARAIGDERLEARGVGARAAWAIEEGRLDDALVDMRRSYEIDRSLGFSIFISVDLVRFGAILIRRGEAVEAAQIVACADRVIEETGAVRESWMETERHDTLALIRARLDEDGFARACEQGRTLSVDEAAALAIGDLGGREQQAVP